VLNRSICTGQQQKHADQLSLWKPITLTFTAQVPDWNIVDRPARTDKRRHQRRKVLIPARLKQDSGWSDVCIRDISPKGLLVQAGSPPPRGAYVELRRGAHIIVAKVAWAKNQHFGLTSQDILPVDVLIQQPGVAGFGRSQATVDGAHVEGRTARRAPSSQQAADRSRRTSSLIQYVFALILALAAAMMLMEFVRDTLGRGVGKVEEALDRK